MNIPTDGTGSFQKHLRLASHSVHFPSHSSATPATECLIQSVTACTCIVLEHTPAQSGPCGICTDFHRTPMICKVLHIVCHVHVGLVNILANLTLLSTANKNTPLLAPLLSHLIHFTEFGSGNRGSLQRKLQESLQIPSGPANKQAFCHFHSILLLQSAVLPRGRMRLQFLRVKK